MTLADMAWMKGQAVHEDGDTAEQASIKAMQHGFLPDTEGYKAFVGGFMALVGVRVAPVDENAPAAR